MSYGIWQDSQIGFTGFGYEKPTASVAKTADGGKTWEYLDLQGTFVNALVVDSSDPLRLYALLEERSGAQYRMEGRPGKWQRPNCRSTTSMHSLYLWTVPCISVTHIDARGVFLQQGQWYELAVDCRSPLVPGISWLVR